MKIKGLILWIMLGILAIGIFTSCEELETMFDEFGVSMNTDYYEIEVIIPPAPAGIEVCVPNLMESDLDRMMESNGYYNATVSSIKVLDAAIEVAENSNIGNLNAVESITTTISTEILPEKVVASCVNTLVDAIVLPMTTEDTELISYMQDEKYILTTCGMLKETTTDTLVIRSRIRYRLGLIVAKESDS